MEDNKYKCSKHEEKKIQYFCAANQWHLVPLCSQCLPSHTQNHSKNVKVMIQKLDVVIEKHEGQKEKAIKSYEGKMQEITKLIQNPEVHKEYQKIEEYREKSLKIINTFFDEVKDYLMKKRKETQKYQYQLLTKLKDNVKIDLEQIKTNHEVLENWIDGVKKVYFKDSFVTYIEEIDQIIKQHQQRTNQKNQLTFGSFDKINEQFNKILRTLVYPIKQKKQEKENEKVKPKVVHKMKKCSNCGSQLQYLTQWKKHLVCLTCGGKQRNYVKKK